MDNLFIYLINMNSTMMLMMIIITMSMMLVTMQVDGYLQVHLAPAVWLPV